MDNNNEAEYESVALHQHPVYYDGCVAVLQEEWARSSTARLSMLSKSNDKLPYCIVLIKKLAPDTLQDAADDRVAIGQSHVEVIGHSRLCQVHKAPRSAYVEAVVICKRLRGKGLGKMLMMETEKHARSLGLDTLYLETNDKEEFYRHLGYEFCPPVLSYGSASKLLSDDKFAGLLEKLTVNETRCCSKLETGCKTSSCKTSSVNTNTTVCCGNTEKNSVPPPSSPPPLPNLPPPPPPPTYTPCCSISMKKILT